MMEKKNNLRSAVSDIFFECVEVEFSLSLLLCHLQGVHVNVHHVLRQDLQHIIRQKS